MNTEGVNVPKKEKKRSEKIFSVATSVFLVIAILFCGLVMFQISTAGYVTLFGCSFFRVATDSMEPELPVGSIIISKKTDIEDIEVGDIISFKSRESYMSGQIVTHRVVDIKEIDGEICLVSRGDSNNSVDGYYVTSENLVGKIIYVIKQGGFITTLYSLLTNKMGFFTIVIVPVLILVTVILQEYIRKITKEIKAIKHEIDEAEQEQKEDELREELRQKLKQEILVEIEAENGEQKKEPLPKEVTPNEADSREAEK